MLLLRWSLTLKIIACTFHGVAISSTIFRLIYRWYMARFWWEDGWALFALAVDVICLVSASLQEPATVPPKPRVAIWMAAMGFPCVLWACRASILFSIVRVANPSKQLRRIAFLVGCSFFIMWAALMGQKIQICVDSGCVVAGSVGVSQLITDVISDASLVILPIYFLRRAKINHRQRIMIFSAFSASLLITAVTIFHSIVLFTALSDGTIVIGHVKTALSLIVCNLLVIVAFGYRMCRRGGDLDATEEEIAFTSVDLNMPYPTESAGDKCTTTVGRLSMASVTSCSMMTATIETTEGGAGSRPSHREPGIFLPSRTVTIIDRV